MLCREVARSVFLAAGMWLAFPWIPGLPSRKTDVRGLIHFGTNLAGANILASLSSGVDRFFIGRYWGPSPVAMYRQAYQLLARPMDQMLGPVYQVSQPGLSMLQSEEKRFCRFYQKVLALVCIASMPISIFVAVYYSEVTRVVLGPRWPDAAPLLMILSFGTFIKQAVGSAAWVLITRGKASDLSGFDGHSECGGDSFHVCTFWRSMGNKGEWRLLTSLLLIYSCGRNCTTVSRVPRSALAHFLPPWAGRPSPASPWGVRCSCCS